jgi:hypothetical protein
MTDLEQLVFDLDLSGTKSSVPEIKRNVQPGAARLLRRLVSGGLDVDALEAAAALVAALDEGAS